MRRVLILTGLLIVSLIIGYSVIDPDRLNRSRETTTAAISGLAGPGREPAVDTTPDLSSVPVVTVVARLLDGYEVEERYAGQVAARRTSSLGFSRGGLISRITVEEGDKVAAGQTLASLDMRVLEARMVELETELDERRSNLAAATERMNLAATIESRRVQLARQDFVSQESFDAAVTSHKVAIADRNAAASAIRRVEASLSSLDVDLALSQLTAPYAGTIVARHVDEGAAVTAGQAVVDLIETGVLEFRVGVPVATAVTLTVGAGYVGVIGGREVQCRLTGVLPQVDAETRTVTAIFALPVDDKAPLPGQIGHLQVARTLATSGYWLPLAALTESHRGLWAAYVLEPDLDAAAGIGTVSRRELDLLHVDGDRAYVTGVLRDGERVIADGVQRLVPGMRVREATKTIGLRD